MNTSKTYSSVETNEISHYINKNDIVDSIERIGVKIANQLKNMNILEESSKDLLKKYKEIDNILKSNSYYELNKFDEVIQAHELLNFEKKSFISSLGTMLPEQVEDYLSDFDELVVRYPNTKITAIKDILYNIKDLLESSNHNISRNDFLSITNYIDFIQIIKDICEKYTINFQEFQEIFFKIILSIHLLCMKYIEKTDNLNSLTNSDGLFLSNDSLSLVGRLDSRQKNLHSNYERSSKYTFNIESDVYKLFDINGLVSSKYGFERKEELAKYVKNLFKDEVNLRTISTSTGRYLYIEHENSVNLPLLLDGLKESLIKEKLKKINDAKENYEKIIVTIKDKKREELEYINENLDMINKQISQSVKENNKLQFSHDFLKKLQDHKITSIDEQQYNILFDIYNKLSNITERGDWNNNSKLGNSSFLDHGKIVSNYIDPIEGVKVNVYDCTRGGGNGLKYYSMVEVVRLSDGKSKILRGRNTRDYGEDYISNIQGVKEDSIGSGKFVITSVSKGRNEKVFDLGQSKPLIEQSLKSVKNSETGQQTAEFQYDDEVASKADAILIYRDNTIYKNLVHDIKQLHKQESQDNKEKSFYIITIPQGTDVISNIDTLRDFLVKYPQARIDNTLGSWTNSNNKRILEIENSDNDPKEMYLQFQDNLQLISRIVKNNTINIIVTKIYKGKNSGSRNRLVEHDSYLDIGDGPQKIAGYGKSENGKKYFKEIYDNYADILGKTNNVIPVVLVTDGQDSDGTLYKLDNVLDGRDMNIYEAQRLPEITGGTTLADGHDSRYVKGSKIVHVGGIVDRESKTNETEEELGKMRMERNRKIIDDLFL